MILPLEERYAAGLDAGRSAQELQAQAEEIRHLQEELGAVDGEAWRSGAGQRFLERLQEIIRDLQHGADALALAAAARRELAATPRESSWG